MKQILANRRGAAQSWTGLAAAFAVVMGVLLLAPGTGWAARRGEDTQLYQIITIDGDELRFEARTATGRLYDAFTLKKRPGRANELIELLPPERRRPVAETQAPATH